MGGASLFCHGLCIIWALLLGLTVLFSFGISFPCWRVCLSLFKGVVGPILCAWYVQFCISLSKIRKVLSLSILSLSSSISVCICSVS